MRQVLQVRQFRFSRDNLGYLVFGGKSALAVDGGAAEDILAFCAANGLVLRYVANTHSHGDHTPGNGRLLAGSQAVFLDRPELLKRSAVDIDGQPVKVIATPGHSGDSVCFYGGDFLLSGDTLFNGTVGNCFSGDMKGFLQSIETLIALPGGTVVYAGHDYVRDSMRVARSIEPQNASIDGFLRRYDPGYVRSTIADELRVNPYVRFNDEALIAVLKKRNLPVETEFQRWTSVMSL